MSEPDAVRAFAERTYGVAATDRWGSGCRIGECTGGGFTMEFDDVVDAQEFQKQFGGNPLRGSGPANLG
ncbi:hypothetical protein U0C82_08225 [Fulvimarina sp. 2208YS6-2-32]|uniref:Uncharacterized protein n=1 Tax=Fulvimarina uroteuthidis TaxID=3098149 RepID=A0ABU5I1C2_9HYPH|nr:hypothetical protein [Fulvimarina sp. 2208YS6-2-32]MDY8109130.1 hypothetical protein [Fulvimarina sp. 2208YS6-2-32]